MIIAIAGHYGVGKTNLALNLALDFARYGWEVVLADVDVVNPYFRSSDYDEILKDAGIGVIAPVYAHTSLDNPSLSSEIAAAIEWAGGEGFEPDTEWARDMGKEFVAPGLPDAQGVNPAPSTDPAPNADFALCSDPSKRVLIIDIGGDDAGATAMGRFSATMNRFPYEFIYVVNKYRNLTQEPAEAIEILSEIERKSHLRATGIVNNSHLRDETTKETVEAALAFGEECARLANLPLLAVAVPESMGGELGACEDSVALLLQDLTSGQPGNEKETQKRYPVKKLVTTPWE